MSHLKIITYCLSLYCLILTGCKTHHNDPLSKEVLKYTQHSLDIPGLLGDSYRILNYKIKDSKLLVKALKDGHSWFFVLDIPTARIVHTIPDPFYDYVTTSFDIDSNNLYTVAASYPDTLCITSLQSKKTEKRILHFEKPMDPGEILLGRNQLFLSHDVYGIAMVNIGNFNKRVFHPETGAVNPTSSTVSLPLDTAINLLSGYTTGRNNIQLIALDKLDSVKWQYNITQSPKNNPVSLLNYTDRFIVAYDSILIALNKEKGDSLYQTTVKNTITNVYKWQDKVLAYSILNPEAESSLAILKLFDSMTGKELWSKDLNTTGTPCIGICNDRLLFSDNQYFSVIDIGNGKELSQTAIPDQEKDLYKFEVVTDVIKGDLYLGALDGRIYW